MSSNNVVSFKNDIGCVFRHNRLFNYVMSPLSIIDNTDLIKCHTGNNVYKEIPFDYFKREWKRDDSINYDDLQEKMKNYIDGTPFTLAFEDEYEVDDGLLHSYVHFNVKSETQIVGIPDWLLTTCTKEERIKNINSFTIILPIQDGTEEQVQDELDILNEIRRENDFIHFDNFQGFELGLIKYLEKKYLRII